MTRRSLQWLLTWLTLAGSAAYLYAQNPVSIAQVGTTAVGTTVPVSGTVSAAQSGTWTVQPGNTANTTAWKVDGSAVTQPVSGTVTANQGGAPWSENLTQYGGNAVASAGGNGILAVGGNAASGAADSANPLKIGGVFNTTQPTVTTGQRVDAQMTARGELLVAKGVSGFSIDNTGFNVNNTPAVTQSGTWNVGTVTSITNTVTDQGTLTNNNAAPSTNNLGALVARATAAAPSYTEGNMVTLSTDNAGALRVSGSSGGGVAQTQVRDLANNWQDVGYQKSNAQMPVYDSVSYQTLQQLLLLLQQQTGYLRGNFGGRIGSVNDALKVYAANPQDPCVGTAKGNVAISQTATTKLIAGIPGLRIFVCTARVVAGAAEIVNFTEGTGTTCGTAETAVSGSTTTANGESYAANGGFQSGAGAAVMITSKAGDDLCLKQNGSNRLAGNLTYAYVP